MSSSRSKRDDFACKCMLFPFLFSLMVVDVFFRACDSLALMRLLTIFEAANSSVWLEDRRGAK